MQGSTPTDPSIPIWHASNYAADGPRGSAQIQTHSHQHVEFFLLRQGRAIITLDRVTHHMESDQCICVLPGTQHAAVSQTPSELFFYDTVSVDLRQLSAGKEDLFSASYQKIHNRHLPLQFVVNADKTGGEAFLSDMSELIRCLREKRPGYLLASRARVDLMLCGLMNMNEPSPEAAMAEDDRLQPVYSYIDAKYMEKISVDLLAGLCAMSKFHFIRYFHSITGQTPIEFINACRIRKACDQLRADNDLKVLTIAMSVGFGDLSNFNKLFKRSVGMTPAEYRRDARLKQSEDAAIYFEENSTHVPFYSFLL